MKLIDIIASLMGLGLLFSQHASAAGGGAGHHLYPPKVADKKFATKPAKVKLVEPKNLAQINASTVELKWEAVENATSYRVQVATDANFKWLVSEALDVQETNYSASGLEKGKQYFWRVAGVKRDNDAGYTQGHFTWSSFEIK